VYNFVYSGTQEILRSEISPRLEHAAIFSGISILLSMRKGPDFPIIVENRLSTSGNGGVYMGAYMSNAWDGGTTFYATWPDSSDVGLSVNIQKSSDNGTT
jgi:hypothetical protein